jgi:pimeloyl-ACP methyl ester carboxylesterase
VKGLGAKVGQMVRMVAANVEDEVLNDSGHFLPEERPDAVVRRIITCVARGNATNIVNKI